MHLCMSTCLYQSVPLYHCVCVHVFYLVGVKLVYLRQRMEFGSSDIGPPQKSSSIRQHKTVFLESSSDVDLVECSKYKSILDRAFVKVWSPKELRFSIHSLAENALKINKNTCKIPEPYCNKHRSQKHANHTFYVIHCGI